MSAMLPAQKLTDEAIGMFGHYLPVAPAAALRNVTSFESEDLAPGQETDRISGIETGMLFGPEDDVSVEVKSHGMGQIVDSLAFQQLLARPDTGLGLDSFEILNWIASNSDTTALEMLLVSRERLLGPKRSGEPANCRGRHRGAPLCSERRFCRAQLLVPAMEVLA